MTAWVAAFDQVHATDERAREDRLGDHFVRDIVGQVSVVRRAARDDR